MSKFDEVLKRISEQTGTTSIVQQPQQNQNTGTGQQKQTTNLELDKAIQNLATQLKVDTKVVQQAIATIQQTQQKPGVQPQQQTNQPAV